MGGIWPSKSRCKQHTTNRRNRPNDTGSRKSDPGSDIAIQRSRGKKRSYVSGRQKEIHTIHLVRPPPPTAYGYRAETGPIVQFDTVKKQLQTRTTNRQNDSPRLWPTVVSIYRPLFVWRRVIGVQVKPIGSVDLVKKIIRPGQGELTGRWSHPTWMLTRSVSTVTGYWPVPPLFGATKRT